MDLSLISYAVWKFTDFSQRESLYALILLIISSFKTIYCTRVLQQNNSTIGKLKEKSESKLHCCKSKSTPVSSPGFSLSFLVFLKELAKMKARKKIRQYCACALLPRHPAVDWRMSAFSEHPSLTKSSPSCATVLVSS